MKIKPFVLVILLALTGSNSFAAPPRLPGNIDEWKVATHLRGPNLTLTLYHQGMPQLSAARGGARLGGIILTQNRKNLSGKLQRESPRVFSYVFADQPDTALRFTFDADNFIAAELSGNSAAPLPRLTFSLLRDELSSGKISVNGTVQPFPAGEQNFQAVREITFHAEDPARAFTLQVGEGTIGLLQLVNAKYGVTFDLRPDATGKSVKMFIIPGVPRRIKGE